jgi:uncharacterized DUF497 family protein
MCNRSIGQPASFRAPIVPCNAASMDLSTVKTEDLVHEVQRRLECLNKPEKRLVLIGEAMGLRVVATVPTRPASTHARVCLLRRRPARLWKGHAESDD